jgi:hypothetical protein
MRQWLWVDWIFSLSPAGREQAKILKILHTFTEKVRKNFILFKNSMNILLHKIIKKR